MTQIELLIPPEHDSFSNITLNGESLLIRFTYNDTFDYWTFGIYELNQKPIVAATRIVPNFPLNIYLPMRRLGNTRFIATCKQQHIGREDFWNEIARFWMVTP